MLQNWFRKGFQLCCRPYDRKEVSFLTKAPDNSTSYPSHDYS
jgi:hypothetical protein